MRNLLTQIEFVLPVLLLTTIILVISQLNNRELILPTQNGKAFGFLWGMLGYIVVAIIIGTIKKDTRTIRITPIDLLSGAYCLLVGISYWLHPTDMLQMLSFGALVLFYLSVRAIRIKYLKFLLLAVVISGTIQAIYGNLQLWGYYPSNHGIFRMTGSFFNPGPFAGYLCAVLPVAVSIYFKSLNVRWFDGLSDKKFEGLNVRMFDRLKTSITQSKTINLFFERSNQLFSNVKPSNSEASNNQTPKSSHILNGIALITIIAIVLVLPASRSRAAWLGALAGCLFVFQTIIRQKTDQTSEASNIQTYFFKLFKPFKQLSLLQKRGLSVVGILLSVLLLVGIYKFKQGSADGRLLIWKVSAEMIKDKPIFGHGADKFAANYMNYQAAYFKPNPDVPEAMQADNVTYAYNEFLKLTVEYGLIGLLLGLGVIGFLFLGKSGKREEGRRQKLEGEAEGRRQKLNSTNNTFSEDYPQPLKGSTPKNESSNLQSSGSKSPLGDLGVISARAGLLSILVFALFSYPSDILPIRMLFVLFMAIVASHHRPVKLFQLPAQKAVFASTAVWYAALAIVLITIYSASQYLVRQYQAYKSWKDATDIYNVGAYPECLEDLELAYPHLKTNGEFLVQYGKSLEMAKKHESSIVILNEARQHLNNTILYTCLGNNYKALGNSQEAEQAYLHAWNMAPARFYPLYLLAKLYNETGQKEKAVAMAKEVLEKEIKIESTAILEIRDEMKLIIEK